MTPKRLQLSRKRGFRLPDDAVNCARPGKWGNPFKADDDMSIEEAVRWHRDLLLMTPARVAQVRQELAGKDLACWCPPESICHADTLLAVANGWPLPKISRLPADHTP